MAFNRRERPFPENPLPLSSTVFTFLPPYNPSSFILFVYYVIHDEINSAFRILGGIFKELKPVFDSSFFGSLFLFFHERLPEQPVLDTDMLLFSRSFLNLCSIPSNRYQSFINLSLNRDLKYTFNRRCHCSTLFCAFEEFQLTEYS